MRCVRETRADRRVGKGASRAVPTITCNRWARLRLAALSLPPTWPLCPPYRLDCFAEPVIGRAFARPVGWQ